MSRTISYSQMHQLRSCGEAFRLIRIERWPKRPSAAAVGGTIVHIGTEAVDNLLVQAERDALITTREDLIETGLRNINDVATEMIEGFCNDDFPTVDKFKVYGKQDMQWYLDVGMPKSIEAYVDWRLAHPELTIDEIPGFGPAIEVPFQYVLEDQLVTGFIDRVFQQNGQGHYPLDIKSGLKPKTDEQLGVYAKALESALGAGWEPSYGLYLYGLKTGTAKMTKPISLQHWSEEKLSRVYLGAIQQIESQIFIPNPGDGCYVCDVSHACQFAQASI